MEAILFAGAESTDAIEAALKLQGLETFIVARNPQELLQAFQNVTARQFLIVWGESVAANGPKVNLGKLLIFHEENASRLTLLVSKDSGAAQGELGVEMLRSGVVRSVTSSPAPFHALGFALTDKAAVRTGLELLKQKHKENGVSLEVLFGSMKRNGMPIYALTV